MATLDAEDIKKAVNMLLVSREMRVDDSDGEDTWQAGFDPGDMCAIDDLIVTVKVAQQGID